MKLIPRTVWNLMFSVHESGITTEVVHLPDLTSDGSGLTEVEALDWACAVSAIRSSMLLAVSSVRDGLSDSYLDDVESPFRVAHCVDILSVRKVMAETPEEVRPIPGYPSYLISNTGVVFSCNGSTVCVHCGGPVGGKSYKKYCSTKCNQNSAFHRKMGRGPRFESTPAPMKSDVDEDGYHRVPLYLNGKSRRMQVHRLVLAAFDRPPKPGEQACHRDDDPGNNHIANLRWGSAIDNDSDRTRHGRRNSAKKLNQYQVKEIRALVASGVRPSAVAKKFGVTHTQVNHIRNDDQWATKPPIHWPVANCVIGVPVEVVNMVGRDVLQQSVADFCRSRRLI